MKSYLEEILGFNDQLKIGNLKFFNREKLKKMPAPDGIVITGMGGSGLPSNLITKLGTSIGLKIPVLPWKDYGLNPYSETLKNPLFVFISFSGNTEETFSGLKLLIQKKNRPKIAVIACGGELKRMAERFRLPFVTFDPQGLTPRQALGYNYYALIKVLRSVFPKISAKDLSKKINILSLEKPAQALARRIKSRIVLIYTDSKNSHLGYVWKTNINETAKLPAFTNFFPEIYHNEITAFEKKHFPFFAIFLIDPQTNKKIIKKTKALTKILNSRKIPTAVLALSGKNPEEKTWNSIVLSHLTSFYLAKLNKVNPKATKLIDQFKKLSK